MRKAYVVALAGFALLLEPVLCPAPAYLKYGGIDGEVTESQSPGHDKWIELQSFSFGVAAEEEPGTPPAFSDASASKQLDKTSPKLMLACATGLVTPEVILDFTNKVGESEQLYMRYKLTDVLVSSYSHHKVPAPAEGGLSAPERRTLNHEEFSLNYGGIRAIYYRYDDSGQLVEVVSEGTIARPGGTIPPDDSAPTLSGDNFTISDSLGGGRTVTAAVAAE